MRVGLGLYGSVGSANERGKIVCFGGIAWVFLLGTGNWYFVGFIVVELILGVKFGFWAFTSTLELH